MTNLILTYLKQVMRHCGLSKREKTEWIDEMSAHLSDEVTCLMRSGFEENDAVNIAIEKFGKPSMLRKRIARDTFGLSVPTIFFLASICLVLFVIDLFVLRSQFPGPWYHRYTDSWDYIRSIVSTIPLSPSLMLGLSMSFLALFKTRCRADRIALVVTLMILGILWMLVRLPLSIDFNLLLFGFKDLTIMEPYLGIITVALVLWGFCFYIWTKNRWIGLFPTLITIPLGMWLPFYTACLVGAHIPMAFVLLPLIRCVPVVVLLLVFEIVDKYQSQHKPLIIS